MAARTGCSNQTKEDLVTQHGIPMVFLTDGTWGCYTNVSGQHMLMTGGDLQLLLATQALAELASSHAPTQSWMVLAAP